MQLNEYRTLGRSGLRVSPLCLGTMTFGTEWGWGAEENSRSIFDKYIEAGGNFVDTADGYTGRKSEQMVRKSIADRRLRDRVQLRQQLDATRAPASIHPYLFFERFIQGMIQGGANVRACSASRPTQPSEAREAEQIGAAK